MAVNQPKKKQALRNNEYYSTQEQFDTLYEKSRQGENFTHLMEQITSEQNILLAYRAIKKNKGSKTKGVNATTIVEMGEKRPEELVAYVRERLQNFYPHAVRRVEIPKPDGRMRPLGIPTMEDRLIQQCIKQVLEPICEAKFYKHSYGFRPNRSAHHAIARAMFLVNLAKYRYVVDVDIKSFFDNVDHGKLLKQLWTLGIRDKRLLCILSKMLKAPIQGEGVPAKGVPQGGILSPLLANVVLNELDWWIASQWETFPQLQRYQSRPHYKGKGTLKQVYLVRYADDFKLFCKNHNDAVRIFAATKMWLKERLGLEISPEKSKIVNLKKGYSDFLGFKLKLRPKSGKWVLKSHMADKAQKKCKENIREAIGRIGREPNQWSVMQFNAMVLGLHEYYKFATNVYLDFDRIAFDVRKTLLCRTKSHRSKTGLRSQAFQQFYGDFTGKIYNVAGLALFPINGVKTTPPMCFSPDICNYTETGRRKIHEMQKAVNPIILQNLMEHPIQGQSMELNDNRISLYVAQRGKCAVCKEPLLLGDMEVHHLLPKSGGGKDNYTNLALVTKDVHKLIHATDPAIIQKYLDKLKCCNLNRKRLNKFRLLAGNCKIEYR
jgi:RNA-directed DNA polymerase